AGGRSVAGRSIAGRRVVDGDGARADCTFPIVVGDPQRHGVVPRGRIRMRGVGARGGGIEISSVVIEVPGVRGDRVAGGGGAAAAEVHLRVGGGRLIGSGIGGRSDVVDGNRRGIHRRFAVVIGHPEVDRVVSGQIRVEADILTAGLEGAVVIQIPGVSDDGVVRGSGPTAVQRISGSLVSGLISTGVGSRGDVIDGDVSAIHRGLPIVVGHLQLDSVATRQIRVKLTSWP